MEVKATLKVFNESEIPAGSGIVTGQTRRRLAGSNEHPSERIRVNLASFKPGTLEHLHWHLTESFHYIISGRAIVKDIEGNSYDAGPGSVIYAPPGIAGSHEWEVKEEMKLITFKATTDPQRGLQFWVDRSTNESKIAMDQQGGAVDFKKSLY